MHFAAAIFLFTFVLASSALWITVRLFCVTSLMFNYLAYWTPEERKNYCPNGLLHTIFLDY